MTGSAKLPGRPTSWVAPARVRLVIADSAEAFLERIRSHLGSEEEEQGTRLVSVVMQDLLPQEALIETMLDHLAEVALALWPDWYAGIMPFARVIEPAARSSERIAEALQDAGQDARGISENWLLKASRCCRAGRKPRVREVPRVRQAAQLGRAIAPKNLLIVLALQKAQEPQGRLLGLARGAEWLARATEGRVLVVVPGHLAGSKELDGISFDSLDLRTQAAPPRSEKPAGPAVDVWPVIGRPHPFSPGEQLLAKRLADDAELGGLFQFNVRVRSRFDSVFLVDLLWPEGRVVVEVDGFEHHSGRAMFFQDRQRDYELVVSGYLVLRLTHDEVIDDVEVAIEKIRDLVQLRRSHGGHST